MVEAKVRFKFPTTLINKVNFDHSELDTQKIISWNWFHGKTLMSNSKVKRWLLNSDIFLWYSKVFLEMLLVKFWHFQKYVRNLFKKMSQLKSQHLTWSGPLNLEMTKLLVDFVKVLKIRKIDFTEKLLNKVNFFEVDWTPMIVFFATLCIILTICYGCYWCAEDEGLFFVQRTSQVKPRVLK